MSKTEAFFCRYEQGANSFDPDLLASLYTAEFMAADPNGVSCGRNDEQLREAFARRKTQFQALGFRRAKVLHIEETPLDARYVMAKVRWLMAFETTGGQTLEFTFYITYFLFDPGTGPKVAFWISHDDELKAMREAGLIG
jgi:hypothetical protein